MKSLVVAHVSMLHAAVGHYPSDKMITLDQLQALVDEAKVMMWRRVKTRPIIIANGYRISWHD